MVWVGNRHVTVIANRDFRPLRQVWVRFIDVLLDLVLFVLGQLVHVRNRYLVTRYVWRDLISHALVRAWVITLIILDHEVFAWNRIRTLIWVRDRDVTMVVGGNLRPLWQRLLTTGILVGVFNCLHNLTLPPCPLWSASSDRRIAPRRQLIVIDPGNRSPGWQSLRRLISWVRDRQGLTEVLLL